MTSRKRRYGPSYRKKLVSHSMRKRSTTYFDYLRTLDDDGLRNEYKKINSYNNESRRKMILNQFLLENDKLEIIG